MQIQTPDWVKHAVFYQIFPDRFAKSQQFRQKLLNSPNWEPWNAPPTNQGYKGGDLWGVIEGLDYIQSLGVNAIYFTPIFRSASNHRYHTHDYYQVDPILGGNEALRELLDKAHQRNIKVVLDGVFNHASRGFFFFHDVLENGPHSPWVDWFKIQDWPLSPYSGDAPANYESWIGIRSLPVFNHDNPDVQAYIFDIAEYWLKFGIDGWRLDVASDIKTPGFWQNFRQRVKAINPDAYIVGEIWGDSRQWLDGTQFDGVMNYLFTAAAIAFTGGDRVIHELVKRLEYAPYPPLTAQEYSAKITKLLEMYPWEINLTQMNLLDSHDTARLITIVDGDRASVELATLLLLTFPGAPNIFYGDEVGLPGGLDPDCRRGFPDPSEWDREFLQLHKQLIAIRNAYTALRIGDYLELYAQGMLYVMARTWENEELVIAVNSGSSPETALIDFSHFQTQPNKLLYGQAEMNWNQQKLSLTLPPRTGCILIQG